MANIYLGNWKLDVIESRLGIELTQADKQLIINNHSESADNIGANQWHGFDIPEVLVFGSYTAFKKFQTMLKNYDVKGNLNIRFLNNDLKQYLAEQELEVDGYPKYLIRTVAWTPGFHHFMKLIKITDKTLVYADNIAINHYYADVLHETNLELLNNDFVIPDFTSNQMQNSSDEFRVRKATLQCEHVIVDENKYDYTTSVICDIFTKDSLLKNNPLAPEYSKETIHELAQEHKTQLKNILNEEKKLAE